MLAYIVLLLSIMLACVYATTPTETEPIKADTADFAQTSPIWLANIKAPDNVVKGYPRDEEIRSGPLAPSTFKIDMTSYPETNKQPPTNHPEVQAVLKLLDFSKVPNVMPRKVTNWAFDMSQYNVQLDADCWWSSSLCKKPKVSYIPEDVYMCPNKGDWGLNYDDGPYRIWWPTNEKEKEFDQPRFYNFLVDKANKQKATLFFVGSNVVKFPEAAQRALNDGHTICSHTWSHPQMTSLTNEEVVAQLYWTQKAIKETLGITPKCWRPPYGDVDDRIRAIAWQMGMRTFLWDQDSNDWNLFVHNGMGHLKFEVVDKYFDTWINNRINNNDGDHGHVTLQHENSNATILMSEKWLPRLQETFKVMPIHQCINDPHPYWEESWVYPTLDEPNPPRTSFSTSTSPADKGQTKNKPVASFAIASSSLVNDALLGVFLCVIISFISL